MSMRALGGVDRVWSGARPQRVTPPPAKPRHLATGGRIGQTSPFAPVLEEGAETRRAEADADKPVERRTVADPGPRPLTESALAPGVSEEEIAARTQASLRVPGEVRSGR